MANTMELVLAFVLLGNIRISRSESQLDVSVEDAFETGIGRYAIPVGGRAQLRCSTRQFPTAQLWILRNEEILLERTYDGPGKVTETYEIVGEDDTAGNYTCRFFRKIKRKESELISFTTEKTVEVILLKRNNLPRCSTSHGESGLPDETITLFCATFASSSEEDILWRGLETTSTTFGSYKFYFSEIQLKNQPSELSCGYYEIESRGHEWTDICSLPPVVVSPYVDLWIEPREFHARNETLRFTCYSDPPSSMISWSIFGHANNIIDDYLVTKLKGEVWVKIKVGFGRSTLEMPSSVIETEGVHVITCSTVRENFKIAISELIDAPPGQQTMPNTLSTLSSKEFSPTPDLSETSSSPGGGRAGLVVVIVLLTIIVIFLVALSLWMFKNQRMSVKNNNRLNRGQQEGSLTATQRCATYEPLSHQAVAPPAYTDLDVGYATMSPPQLDDQHYMEPVTSKADES